MQQLAINFNGQPRRERLQGRDYFVAPLTLIVPGVLNGSKGALLYPTDEIEKSIDSWNGVPIVVFHPEDPDGSPRSARDPDILNKQGIGVIMRCATSTNGKLKAEGWFDIEATRRVNTQIYADLVAGRPIELSTGLFTDNEERQGTYKGTGFDYVARNYRPDHLAILPGQTGACSIQDGCGVHVNNNRKKPECNEDEECDCEECKVKQIVDNYNPYRDDHGRYTTSGSASTKDGKKIRKGKKTNKGKARTAEQDEDNRWLFASLDRSNPASEAPEPPAREPIWDAEEQPREAIAEDDPIFEMTDFDPEPPAPVPAHSVPVQPLKQEPADEFASMRDDKRTGQDLDKELKQIAAKAQAEKLARPTRTQKAVKWLRGLFKGSEAGHANRTDNAYVDWLLNFADVYDSLQDEPEYGKPYERVLVGNIYRYNMELPMDMIQNILANYNPEGCNQYKACGAGGGAMGADKGGESGGGKGTETMRRKVEDSHKKLLQSISKFGKNHHKTQLLRAAYREDKEKFETTHKKKITPSQFGRSKVEDATTENQTSNRVGSHASASTINRKESGMTKLTANQRKLLINKLVGNCKCDDKGKKVEEAAFNQLSDLTLVTLVKNAFPPPKKKKPMMEEEDMEYEEEEMEFAEEEEEEVENTEESIGSGSSTQRAGKDTDNPGYEGTGNRRSATLNAREWLSKAPPEFRSMIQKQIKADRVAKHRMIEAITANSNNRFPVEVLRKMTTEQLEPIAALAKPTVNNEDFLDVVGVGPDYFGAGAHEQVTNEENVEGTEAEQGSLLIPPTINWAAEAKSRKHA